MWHERKPRSRWAAVWPPPYTQTILPCSEGACAQEEKRKQPVALKQRDVTEDEKATIDFFFFSRFPPPPPPLFLWDCFTSSLAPLFGCGVCLKCNSGTIYEERGIKRTITCVWSAVAGGLAARRLRQRHSSSTDGVFFSRRGDRALNFNVEKYNKQGWSEGENFTQTCCYCFSLKHPVCFSELKQCFLNFFFFF